MDKHLQVLLDEFYKEYHRDDWENIDFGNITTINMVSPGGSVQVQQTRRKKV